MRCPQSEDGTAHGSSLTREDRVYLNRNAEYKFSIGTVLAYVVYLPPSHHLRSLIYRFLVMTAPRFLSSWLWVITDVYYESVLKDNHVLKSQGFINDNMLGKIYSEEPLEAGQDSGSFYARLDHAMLLYVPLVTGCVNMLLLYFLVVRPKDICQTLTWTEKGHAKTTAKKWGTVPKRRRGFPTQLYDNLKYRLSRLLSRSFWRNWWDTRVCRFSPLFRTGRSLALSNKVDVVKQFVYMLVMFPLQVLYVFVHTLPCCAVFNNLYTEPATLLLSGCCISSKRYVRIVSLVMAVAMTIAGVVLWYSVILEVAWFGAYITIFLSIDILRNFSSTLSTVVFVCSLLLYIKKSSRDFEQRYRKLKLDLFILLENYPDAYVLRSDGNTRLYITNEEGHVSIPRCLFEEVCKRYHPYRWEVFKTLSILLLTLLSLAFLFTVVVELQVFNELTTTGEGLLLVATVSVPAVLGVVRSDTERALQKVAIRKGIEAMVENMFELKEEEDSE